MDRPGDTTQGLAPELNYFFAAEFTKNSGETTLESGDGGNGDETIFKKGRRHFLRKNRATLPVAAPGDTNLSDATAGIAAIEYRSATTAHGGTR